VVAFSVVDISVVDSSVADLVPLPLCSVARASSSGTDALGSVTEDGGPDADGCTPARGCPTGPGCAPAPAPPDATRENVRAPATSTPAAAAGHWRRTAAAGDR
jgi:hypothetical protein